jgi:hypothetical protein
MVILFQKQFSIKLLPFSFFVSRFTSTFLKNLLCAQSCRFYIFPFGGYDLDNYNRISIAFFFHRHTCHAVPLHHSCPLDCCFLMREQFLHLVCNSCCGPIICVRENKYFFLFRPAMISKRLEKVVFQSAIGFSFIR